MAATTSSEPLFRFVRSILKRAELHKDVLPRIEPHLHHYEDAFTHGSVDPDRSYEFYEFVGDTFVNASVVQYITERFPHLRQPRAVKILARYKTMLIQKPFLSDLAVKHSFDQHVRSKAMTPGVLGDVFEAFFGCTGTLVDRHISRGIGYTYCYQLLESFLRHEQLPTSYEDLFDARTRIKEVIDINQDLGQLEFCIQPAPNPAIGNFGTADAGLHCSCVLMSPDQNRKTILSEAWGRTKADVVQRASEKAILALKNMGYERTVPNDLRLLMKGPSSNNDSPN